MLVDELVCFHCGVSLADMTLPLRRLEVCPDCDSELHVCLMCRYYDTHVAKSCREPIAEEVRDKRRANFCDYFTPRGGAYIPPDPEAEQAQAQLQSLFGDEADSDKSSLEQLDDLFKKPPG